MINEQSMQKKNSVDKSNKYIKCQNNLYKKFYDPKGVFMQKEDRTISK